MSLLLAASLPVLALMSGIALVNLIFASRLHRFQPRAAGSVSLLIPARDEAENLRENLPALLAQRPAPLEVLVLDDGSSDGTAEVVRSIAARSGGAVRLLHGAPLPPGWGGKNWACHQLAAAARGDVLIFCDADVRPESDAVGRTTAAMEAAGAGMLTALPRHRFDSWFVAAVVPLVAWLPVVALLPLPLVPRVRSPSLGMGNGQWLAFTRTAYAAAGGHHEVCGDVLEDVALARRAKQAGVRLLVAAAPRTLEVRMYRDWGEMRRGFGKNLYALAGGTAPRFVLVVAIALLVGAVPLLAPLVGGWAYAAPAMLVFVRLCGAVLLGQGPVTVLLHPVGVVLAAAIAAESAVRSGERVVWKGRRMPAAAEGGERRGGG